MAWRARRRPQEDQETAFREQFDPPQWGPPAEQVDVNLSYYRFPLERMTEIGEERGYQFVERYIGRYGAGVRFKRRADG